MKAEAIKLPGLELEAEIGRGAFSVLYLARRGDQRYAVKVIKDSTRDHFDDIAARFRSEGSYLARLSHPSLATIYDYGRVGDRSYLIMEYVEGQSLAAMLEKGPLSEARIVTIAKVVAGALCEVHRHGLVHRDIKPANILIDLAGHVKLIDFGLATSDAKALTTEIVGSFLYSSPEQTGMIKRAVDNRSDLYSLGAVMYECAAGRPPFGAADVNELIRQHAVEKPPRLTGFRNDLSPALQAIIDRLLAKDPDDRYQSSRGLLKDLERIDGLNDNARSGMLILGEFDDALAAGADTKIVGRDHELDSLRKAWIKARAGHGGMMLIEGEPGAGKSRIVRELMRFVRDISAGPEGHGQLMSPVVLQGKCVKGAAMPFGPLRESIEQMLSTIGRLAPEERERTQERVREAAGEFASLLSRFSPGLSRILAAEGTTRNMDEAHEQFYQALATFLVRIARSFDGALICIDDVQWLDDSSGHVLKQVSAMLSDAPVLLLATSRNDRDSVAGLEVFVRDYAPVLKARMTVGPLKGDAARRLVWSLLGNHPVDASFVDQVTTRCSGSPFMIGEYIRAMLDKGLLRYSWGSWLVDTEGLERLDLPTDVIQLVLKRIRDLNEITTEILSFAALQGSAIDARLLLKVARVDRQLVFSSLAEAQKANLIERIDSDAFVFVHDRIREALLAQFDAATQRQMNQRIAEVMDQRAGGARSEEEVYLLAKHFARGTIEKKPVRVYETNLAAGLLALRNFAFREAHDYLRFAEKTATDHALPAAAELYHFMGEAAFRMNHLDEAASSLRRALSLPSNSIERARSRLLLARVEEAALNTHEAMAHAEQCFIDLGAKLPRTEIARFFLAMGHLAYGIVASKIRSLYGNAPQRDRERMRILLDLSVAYGRISYHDFRDMNLFYTGARGLYLSSRMGSQHDVGVCHAMFGPVLGLLKLKTQADQVALSGIRIAEQIGDKMLLAEAKFYRAIAREFAGDPEAGADIMVDVLTNHGTWLDVITNANASFDHIWIRCFQGYMRDACYWADKVYTRYAQGDAAEHPGAMTLHSLQAGMKASMGNGLEAADHLKIAERLATQVPDSRMSWSASLVSRLFYNFAVGAPPANTDELERLWAQKVMVKPSRALLHVRYYYIILAHVRLSEYLSTRQGQATDEELDQALRKFERAVRDLRPSRSIPIFRGHYQALLGSLHWLRGKPQKSLALLEAADRHSQRVIDAPWVAAHAARIRAHIHFEQGRARLGQREADIAIALLHKSGFVTQVRTLRREFQMDDQSALSHKTASHAFSQDGGSKHSLKIDRYLKALLEVSTASSKILDPDLQARVVLREIMRILGAERAMLLLANESGEKLQKVCCIDTTGEVEELVGFSTTVVEQVRSMKKPVVLSSVGEGSAIGAESVIAHDLRSVLAAPLLLKNRLIGVVYADSRLSKGLFTNDDVEIMLAIANHIAAAIETARAARLESEKLELKKDIEVTGAVQSLLLPRSASHRAARVVLSSLYQPAAQSGGDWWWFDECADGRLLVFMGDVTGHGAGAAMITAAVAASYLSVRDAATQMASEPGVMLAIKTIDRNLEQLGNQDYLMTFAVLSIDPRSGFTELWSAGSPQPVIARSDGKLETMVCRGDPLGCGFNNIGHTQTTLHSGDRLFLFTDGLAEALQREGSRAGKARLRHAMQDSQKVPNAAVPEFFSHLIRATLDGSEQSDDVSLVIVDVGEDPAGPTS